ncbi:helix-turn-helix domain-containing protein [Brachybacterium squillarum]|uniref:helix-turn-helix domain-containing protein n=1 Tax=Brachybacterium squillarum TaxID=661979 RepID=UPI0002629A40|nr:helix-turn-helix domain-containing protein [Brachybacterium squillarum]
MKASSRAEREQRDARIVQSLAAGATIRQAADTHGVSRMTAHRALENAKGVLPEAQHARDLMLARFQMYRLRLFPLLSTDPVRAVPRLLEVDTTEAKMRGYFEPDRDDGTAEASGMLAGFIAGLADQRDRERGQR